MRSVGDAPIYGIGAYLLVVNEVKQWNASGVNPFDEEYLGEQQLFETLNLLVVLRLWFGHWGQTRATLEVQAGNMTALSLVLTEIAREVALDLGRRLVPMRCVLLQARRRIVYRGLAGPPRRPGPDAHRARRNAQEVYPSTRDA